SGLSQYSYLTPEFLFPANHIFDQAATSVSENATLSQRVRNARASVDYAILMLYPNLVKSGFGSSLNRELIAQRLLQTRNEQITLRYPAEAQEAKRKEFADQIKDLTTVPAQVPLPD